MTTLAWVFLILTIIVIVFTGPIIYNDWKKNINIFDISPLVLFNSVRPNRPLLKRSGPYSSKSYSSISLSHSKNLLTSTFTTSATRAARRSTLEDRGALRLRDTAFEEHCV